MPSGSYVNVALEVNQRKLAEYKIKDKIYTEVDLHGPTSYTIEDEGQLYPVVPFAVYVHLVGRKPLWLKVHLDGQQICSRPLLTSFKCDAVKSGRELRELLFSIPKIVEDQEAPSPLGKYAGSLKVAVFETRVTGERSIPIYSKSGPRTSGRHGQVLKHLTKKDVQLSHKAAETGAVVSREGRTMMELEATGRFRRGQNFVCTEKILEEIVIHIRPIMSNLGPVFEQNAKFVDKLGNKEHEIVRKPLGDVSNSLKLANSNSATTAQDKSNAKITEQQKEISYDNRPIPPGTSGIENTVNGSSSHDDDQHAAADTEFGETAGKDAPSFESQTFTGLLPADRMKTRQSCMFLPAGGGATMTDHAPQLDLIPAELIKKRQSFLIPSDLIKRRESAIPPSERESAEQKEQGAMDNEEGAEGSGLIPPERIKKRQSFLIPADLIKRRESCVMPMQPSTGETWGGMRLSENMIPPEQIKRRQSTWVPPRQIKRRESELGSCSPTSEESTDNVEDASHSSRYLQEKVKINDESFIVIDESDDEDSILYLYDEADDSVVCVGDDDCYMLDISQNLSLVELNSDDESMEDE